MPTEFRCEVCGGYGVVDRRSQKPCPACGGTGFREPVESAIDVHLSISADEARCGTTRSVPLPADCEGASVVATIPAGVQHGAVITLEGVGRWGHRGRGDVHLRVTVVSEPDTEARQEIGTPASAAPPRGLTLLDAPETSLERLIADFEKRGIFLTPQSSQGVAETESRPDSARRKPAGVPMAVEKLSRDSGVLPTEEPAVAVIDTSEKAVTVASAYLRREFGIANPQIKYVWQCVKGLVAASCSPAVRWHVHANDKWLSIFADGHVAPAKELIDWEVRMLRDRGILSPSSAPSEPATSGRGTAAAEAAVAAYLSESGPCDSRDSRSRSARSGPRPIGNRRMGSSHSFRILKGLGQKAVDRERLGAPGNGPARSVRRTDPHCVALREQSLSRHAIRQRCRHFQRCICAVCRGS